MRHIIVFMVGALMMAGCASQATFGDAIIEGEPTPLPTPIVPSKPVYQVERGDIIYERRFFGRITPVVTNNISFPVDGRVLETFVAAGDQVVTGDVLAVLDTSNLEQQLLDAEEELAVTQSIFDSATNKANFDGQRAQLNLELAQLRLNQAIQSASDEPTSDEAFLIDTRVIERNLAQLSVDEVVDGIDPELRFDVTRAQSRVDDLNAQIAQAQLIASMDGQLTSFAIGVGDNVVAFETVAVISDMSELEITEELNSDDMVELAEGMLVTIQRSGAPGEVFDGEIVALPSPYGTGVDELIHIKFITPPTDDLGVGDRMNFDAIIDQREDVLVLPSSAIRQFSGREFVVVQTESVQQRVDVKLGLAGDGVVEILEGVEENQTVIGP